MAVPRFLVPTIPAGTRVVPLPEDEAHHASRVLRLTHGDVVGLFDGTGHEWAGRIGEVVGRQVNVEIDGTVDPVREPVVQVTLAVGLLKGDQMDTVVREATALGASAIAPILSERVVAPARARVEAARERWRRVAIQSAKQCGRAVVPEISEPIAFAAAIAETGYRTRMMLAEPQTGAEVAEQPPAFDRAGAAADVSGRVLLLVGPEGGWTAGEVDRAVAAGISLWRLGPRTLKAELAPTVALAALWTSWGW